MATVNWRLRAYSVALLHHASCLREAREYKRRGMYTAYNDFMGLVRTWADRARMYRNHIVTS